MAADRDFTPAEIIHAGLAGIPANRPGLLGEYPKMLYRAGPGKAHTYQNVPLKMQGEYSADTLVVENAEEEREALAEGWGLTPDGKEPAPAAGMAEKDEEIAALKVLLEASIAQQEKRGPGRPPKPVEAPVE